MIERNIDPNVFDIYSKEDLRRISLPLAKNIYNGQRTNIIINVHTNEFDSKRYNTTSSPKNQGGWRKHTYEVNVSGKGSFHVRSKPHNTKKLYIVNELQSNDYYSTPDILSPIYWELDILEGRIIIENITIKSEKDLLSVLERFNEISTLKNSSIEKTVVSHVFHIDAVVENDTEISDIVELLTKLTILRFAPNNCKIGISYTFNINVAKTVNLEGLPIKAAKYKGRLMNEYEFRLEYENSKEVSFDYKIPNKGYTKNEVRSYHSKNLILEKIRKAKWGKDYIRPDETDKLCTDGLKAYAIETHTFVRNLC